MRVLPEVTESGPIRRSGKTPVQSVNQHGLDTMEDRLIAMDQERNKTFAKLGKQLLVAVQQTLDMCYLTYDIAVYKDDLKEKVEWDEAEARRKEEEWERNQAEDEERRASRGRRRSKLKATLASSRSLSAGGDPYPGASLRLNDLSFEDEKAREQKYIDAGQSIEGGKETEEELAESQRDVYAPALAPYDGTAYLARQRQEREEKEKRDEIELKEKRDKLVSMIQEKQMKEKEEKEMKEREEKARLKAQFQASQQKFNTIMPTPVPKCPAGGPHLPTAQPVPVAVPRSRSARPPIRSPAPPAPTTINLADQINRM